MRALIMASGAGPDLSPHTDDRPVCMVEVKGRSILAHQVEAYRANGVDDIVVIAGHRHGAIEHPGVQVIHHEAHENETALMGLFSAGTLLTGEVIVSYGNIVFGPETVSGLLHDHACASPSIHRQ